MQRCPLLCACALGVALLPSLVAAQITVTPLPPVDEAPETAPPAAAEATPEVAPSPPPSAPALPASIRRAVDSPTASDTASELDTSARPAPEAASDRPQTSALAPVQASAPSPRPSRSDPAPQAVSVAPVPTDRPADAATPARTGTPPLAAPVPPRRPLAAPVSRQNPTPVERSAPPPRPARSVRTDRTDTAPPPQERPAVITTAAPVMRERPRAEPALCEDPRLVGKPVAAVPGRLPGCGIPKPVQVTEVAGVALDRPILANCTLSRSLADWVEARARPVAQDTLGSPLVGLQIAASYACRTRNHQPGARLSEHATGNAVDIAAFDLADGRTVTVQAGWRNGVEGQFLRRLQDGACLHFGTVLGPNADRWHQNHFHFDAADRRTAYCR